MVQINFDADAAPDMPASDLLPDDWYQLIVVKSELKATKDGFGKYLAFEFNLVGQEHQGRKLWSNYTLVNKSEKAVRMGQAQLKGLCHACGVNQLKDTDQLRGIVFGALVKTQKGKGDYGPSNVLRDYCSNEIFSDVQGEWREKNDASIAGGAKALPATGAGQPTGNQFLQEDQWEQPSQGASPL